MTIAGRIKERRAFHKRCYGLVMRNELERIREHEAKLPHLRDVVSFAVKAVKMEMLTKQIQLKTFLKKLFQHAHEMHDEERNEDSWYDSPGYFDSSSSGYGS